MCSVAYMLVVLVTITSGGVVHVGGPPGAHRGNSTSQPRSGNLTEPLAVQNGGGREERSQDGRPRRISGGPPIEGDDWPTLVEGSG